MFTPEEIEYAIFGSGATVAELASEPLIRTVMMLIEFDSNEVIKFEASRLAKLHHAANANLIRWAFSGNSEGDAHGELVIFRDAMAEMKTYASTGFAQGQMVTSSRWLNDAVWNYLSNYETQIREERTQFQLELTNDIAQLNQQDAHRAQTAITEFKRALLGVDAERASTLAAVHTSMASLADADDVSDCSAIQLCLALTHYVVYRDSFAANLALRQCLRAERHARPLSKSIARQFSAYLSAVDGDLSEADYRMVDGGTVRPEPHALVESGMYAGANGRSREALMLFGAALTNQATVALNLLAAPDSGRSVRNILQAVVDAQAMVRKKAKLEVSKWANAARAADDAAELLGHEGIAGKHLIKDHHRFANELATADLWTAEFILRRAHESRQCLIEESNRTLHELHEAAAAVVHATDVEIDQAAALLAALSDRAKMERNADQSQARLLHDKTSKSYKGIELGFTIALGLTVSIIGTYLAIAAYSSLRGSDLKSDSPIGVILIVAGAIPIGLMASAHVVHGFFHMKASDELGRLMKVAEDIYQRKLAEITKAWSEKDQHLKKIREDQLHKLKVIQEVHHGLTRSLATGRPATSKSEAA